MAHNFHRVSQALYADTGFKSNAGLLIGIVLLGLWVAWSFEARVTRYEVSDAARLEVAGSAYLVQANVSGQLAASHLALGKEVHKGDILVELNTDSERLSLQEERTRLASLAPQLAVLHSEISAQTEGRIGERHVLNWSLERARASYAEAESQARLAEQDAERSRLLRADGIVAEAEAQRTKAEAQRRRAAAESLKVAIGSLEPELKVREADREVRSRSILADVAKLEAQQATSAAAIQRLEYEIERRRIRAVIDGRLSECAMLRPGTHITEGERLGYLMPKGNLQVIAEFPPAAALGKLRPGQPAVVKLNGFPWAQYGTVSATVSTVAGEIRDGKVRVELAVTPNHRSSIPFQHGLPGSVEIEVERISPAALLLRTAGRLVGAH